MFKRGPISPFLHGVLDYVLAAVLIAAPFLFAFDADAAVAMSVVVGVIVISVAASTDGPTSLENSLPLSMHLLLDFALAAVLIAAPFLFGFSDETAATTFFLVLGVAHLLMTIGTRFKPSDAPTGAR